ncbi:MAG: septum formation initiator family protein [Taibaiella sp.]|nr:septum formation initiator family protein [Taibaiella sp.]
MKKVWKIVANKYFITGVAFITWCMFFDQNDWLSMHEKENDLTGQISNNAYLRNEIAKMDKERYDLLNDQRKIEKYARENYHMKRENEDVYVVDSM